MQKAKVMAARLPAFTGCAPLSAVHALAVKPATQRAHGRQAAGVVAVPVRHHNPVKARYSQSSHDVGQHPRNGIIALPVSRPGVVKMSALRRLHDDRLPIAEVEKPDIKPFGPGPRPEDRKSTRLNSSHVA